MVKEVSDAEHSPSGEGGANNPVLAYEEEGTGRPLVLLHGAFSDRRMWQKQFDGLSDEFRVIAVDLRGHGETGVIEGRNTYSIDLYAEDVKKTLDALDLDEPPVVCGLSLGAMVAQRYAERYPEETAGLVSASGLSSEIESVVFRVQLLVNFLVASVARLIGPERVAGVWMQVNEFFHGEVEQDDELKEISKDFFEENASAFPMVLEGVTTNVGSRAYGEIEVPSLLLYGEEEPELLEAHAERMHSRLPDSEVVEIPDAGHMSAWDNPGEFNSTVARFVDELEES